MTKYDFSKKMRQMKGFSSLGNLSLIAFLFSLSVIAAETTTPPPVAFPVCDLTSYSMGNYANPELMTCASDCGASNPCVAKVGGVRRIYNLTLVSKDGSIVSGVYSLEGKKCPAGSPASRECPIRVTSSFSAICKNDADSCNRAEVIKMFYKLEQDPTISIPDLPRMRTIETSWETAPQINAYRSYAARDNQYVCPDNKKVLGIDNFGVPLCQEDPLARDLACAQDKFRINNGPCGGTTTQCQIPYTKTCTSGSGSGKGNSGTGTADVSSDSQSLDLYSAPATFADCSCYHSAASICQVATSMGADQCMVCNDQEGRSGSCDYNVRGSCSLLASCTKNGSGTPTGGTEK